MNNWCDDLASFFRKNFMKRKFDYYKIYIHNFSYFDAVFLLDVLTTLGNVKPLMRENKFLKINFSFKINDNDKRICRLIFYDSNLIFQASLRSLSNSFKIENAKTYFPFGFMNKNSVNFNYSGAVPKLKEFIGTISEEEYKKYCEKFKNKPWNFSLIQG